MDNKIPTKVKSSAVIGMAIVGFLVSTLLVQLGWNLIVLTKYPHLIISFRQALGVAILLITFVGINGGRN